MPEREHCPLFEFKRNDRGFLRIIGIRLCVIRDPRPEPLPEPLRKERRARFTETDAEWLKACGISWNKEPAVQLPLDFSGCRKKEQDPKPPTSQKKEEST